MPRLQRFAYLNESRRSPGHAGGATSGAPLGALRIVPPHVQMSAGRQEGSVPTMRHARVRRLCQDNAVPRMEIWQQIE